MTQVLQNVSNKHRLMMEAMVFDGLDPREVCARYDMTEGRFSIIRKSPLWKLEEKELRAAFLLEKKKQMESLLPKAIKTLERNLTCASPTAEISAAKAILDRGGMPANLIIETEDKTDTGVMYDTLRSIREEKEQVLAELGVESVDDLIEAECTHIDEEDIGKVG